MIGANLSDFLISLIHVYQKHGSKFFRGACIYTPSCSQYSIDAVQRYGAFKGTILALHRILRCRPPYEGGFDPVD